MTIEASFPDPLLSAKLFCDRLQDWVVSEVLAPFIAEVSAMPNGSSTYLWFVRYAHRGQHLKVRVHGPDGLHDFAKATLEARFAAFTSRDTIQDLDWQRSPAASLPPIDPEDEFEGLEPDLTLRWTTYRRSPISLGAAPLLEDDRYAALLTRCLGVGCARILQTFHTDNEGQISHARRQQILLDILLDGLSDVGLKPAARLDYLRYHRDWLIRHTLQRGSADLATKAPEMVQLFEQRYEKMAKNLTQLARVAEERWSRSAENQGRPFSALADWVRDAARQQPTCYVDPFASDAAFPALFKALHGAGNQLGLQPVGEALAYHLLTRALEPTAPPPAVQLRPMIVA